MLDSCGRRALIFSICSIFMTPIVRADPPGGSVVKDDQAQLEEVIVTSQRRPENLQTVPINVTVTSGTELLNAGVTDTGSLSMAVPGLSYTQTGNSATPFIRGVGTTTASAGTESSVATYVDGVYVSSVNASLFELNNIDRVEVLMGPQGTLFGRNATGGVIQIITKDPSLTPSATINADYANYNTTSGSFYGTTGIGDRAAIDLAAYGRNQADGWGTDLTTGQPTYTRHDYGARAKLLLNPADGTRILVAMDFNRTRNEDGLGWHAVPPAVGVDGVTRYSGFYNTFGAPNDYTDVAQTGLSLTAEQDVRFARLVSITSWRNVNAAEVFDEDATPLEIVGVNSALHDKTVTEELHLLSKDGAGLPWIAGLYYFDDLSEYDPVTLDGLFAAPLDGTKIASAQKSKSYAAFGQVAPQIATGTHLTLGARYTDDRRSVTGSTMGLIGPETLALGSGSQSTSWKKLTWRIALDHQFTPDIMTYISDDRGFKSGVYNILTYSAAPVNPETLDAYQLGIKSEFYNHRLRFNAAAFYYNYKDIQIEVTGTGGLNLVNAAAAKMRGIDADFAVLPIDALTLRGGVEWMRGYYTSFNNAPLLSPNLGPGGMPVGGNSQSGGDASGFDTVRTPKATATASADYRMLVPGGSLDFVISDYYNSGFAWDPANRLRQPSYNVLNASVDWKSSKNGWGVRLWGRNLTGSQYCAFETASSLLDSCAPARPKTYGITVSAHLKSSQT